MGTTYDKLKTQAQHSPRVIKCSDRSRLKLANSQLGGLYGAVAELVPEVTNGAGLPFGAAFWLVVDETAVPVLGLSKPPNEYPVSTHVYALTSHLVYGLTAEVVRRDVRKALS